MGLGKTLQMISVIYSDKEDTAARPSLIVCPASLVYNWQEEFGKFAPSLSTLVLSGTLAARKTKLEKYMDYDVCIISYDTLKRDIVMYKDKYFQHCILDEAQYIKNPKAAVSKAVKTISADHRFALTGTPIENRLSELWSIFDFLMPGFLYTLDEFTNRFELPIVGKKDEEAAARLRKMTGPFILRRCKQDVLKDLPAKLEEVRYARLEGRQQQVYNAQVVRLKGMLTAPSSGPKDRIKVLAELTRIRQICCDPSLLLEDYKGESAKHNVKSTITTSPRKVKPVIANKEIYKQRMEEKKAQAAARRAARAAEKARLEKEAKAEKPVKIEKPVKVEKAEKTVTKVEKPAAKKTTTAKPAAAKPATKTVKSTSKTTKTTTKSSNSKTAKTTKTATQTAKATKTTKAGAKK